jgi:hypothetical protein
MPGLENVSPKTSRFYQSAAGSGDLAQRLVTGVDPACCDPTAAGGRLRESSELLGEIEQALRSSAASARERMQSHQKDVAIKQEQNPLVGPQCPSSTAYDTEVPTTYNQLLHPWCIVQPLPHMQHRIVARFRRRNDADAHLRALCRLTPLAQYRVVFSPR